jgi:hypothetical protein
VGGRHPIRVIESAFGSPTALAAEDDNPEVT